MNTTTAAMLSLLAALLPTAVRADYFQIFDGARQYYIPYAHVYMNGQLYGYTDMYGRIKIDLRSGRYVGEVEVRGVRKRIAFDINGARQLKRINAQ